MVKTARVSIVILLCLTGMSCKETPERWNKKAVKASLANKHEEAIRCYEKTITLDPDNLQAHYFLGRLYQQEGKLDSAVSAYKRALTIDPEKKDLYTILGRLYFAQGRIEEALTQFKKALARDSDTPATYYDIGMAYKQLNKNTAAAQHLYEAGLLAFIQGDTTTALNAYRALEEIGPERIVQELHQVLEPLVEDATKGVNLLNNGESKRQGAGRKGESAPISFS